MPPAPSPTLTDKLALLPNLTRALLSVLARILTRPLTTSQKANTYLKDVVFAGLRAYLGPLRPGTEQWLLPAREKDYFDLAKRKGFEPATSVVAGVNVRWLGPKTSKKVLLYFHGGGYVLPASPGHWTWLYEGQQRLAGRVDGGFSVVVPEYSLAPGGQYPQQLREGAEVLRWLVEQMGYQPENVSSRSTRLVVLCRLLSDHVECPRRMLTQRQILIAGDSAGGNLSLALLLHLLHPHPSLPTLPKLSAPLAGAVLISPWCKFATDDASFKRNAGSDMIAPAAVERWSNLFMGTPICILLPDRSRRQAWRM